MTKCRCDKEKEIVEMHVLVKEMHTKLMGNGQQGLIAEFNQAKGVIKFVKWFMPPTFIIAVISLIWQII